MPKRLAMTGPHTAEIRDYDEPPLQPGKVRVKTELASGKHGTTMAAFRGTATKGYRFHSEMRLFTPDEAAPPWVAPGSEPRDTGNAGVGVVVELGEGVTRWKLGDRVFGWLDVRETNVCDANGLYELGDIPPDEALCIDPAYVAFHSVRESNVRYGDSVAVVGLGAIGLVAVRMALGAGAEGVFAIDPLPARREWCASHGATAVLDPTACDAALEVHRLTGGKGVDVAIEVSGSYAGLHTAIRATRLCGTICSAGFYQGEANGIWLGNEWHHNRLSMVVPHGCGTGHPPRDFPRWDERRAYDVIVGLLRSRQLTLPDLVWPIVSLVEGPRVFSWIDREPSKVIKFAVRF
jgi:threonine dehydrogenase-like Zn-dependent dehydrogenase